MWEKTSKKKAYTSTSPTLRTHANNYTHSIMIPFHAIFPLTGVRTAHTCAYTHSSSLYTLMLTLSNVQFTTADTFREWESVHMGKFIERKLWRRSEANEQARTKSLENGFRFSEKEQQSDLKTLTTHTHTNINAPKTNKRTIPVCAFEASDDSWHAVLTRAHSYTRSPSLTMFCLFAKARTCFSIRGTTSLSTIAVRWNNKTNYGIAQPMDAFYSSVHLMDRHDGSDGS